MKTTAALIVLTIALFCAARAHALVTFDWAAVGNPGNADDIHGAGYGGVDYTYSISKYEVTAGQYTEFLNAVATSDPHGLYNPSMWLDAFGCKIEQLGSAGSYTYQVTADRENRPVNYVSFFDAMRFTNWLHNGQRAGDTETGVYNISDGVSETRFANAKYWIPSADEWYKAAYHKNDGVTGNYFDYPTSSDSDPRNDLINPDPGNNANFDQSGYTIGAPYWMTEVGEFENSASPYGTFDQGGNVFEWNETLIRSSSRGLRGGSFGSNDVELRAVSRGDFGLVIKGFLVGFRVATVPEPSTVMLGASAAVGLMLRRRV